MTDRFEIFDTRGMDLFKVSSVVFQYPITSKFGIETSSSNNDISVELMNVEIR